MATTRKFKKEAPKQESSKFSIYKVYVAITLLLLIIYALNNKNFSTKETTWQDFRNMLVQHDVQRIDIINKELVEVFIKPDSLKKAKYKDISQKTFFKTPNLGPHYRFRVGSIEIFENRLDETQFTFSDNQKIAVTYAVRTDWWNSIFIWILPLVFIIFIWVMIMRRASGLGGSRDGMFNFGKARAVVLEKDQFSPITFKEVAGYEEAKTEIIEVVNFLKNPDRFTRLGAKIPKGVLLVGPPGTGKTLMAKAVAGEAGVPFFSLSGSEFIEMFVGVGASRVRDLFEKAKQKAPSIVFIDEIDTVGRIRGKAMSIQANDERESTLNQLLAEMDGFASNTGVIVLAATNRADILDPALIRPGRFDRHIYLELPNKIEREAIFKVHLSPLTIDNSVNAESLSAQTPGFSGADIANVCNEAALIAARNEKDIINVKDFANAIERIVAGVEKETTIITPQEKKIIAYHEAGHALVSWMLVNVDPLVKVSIIPRGKSLGSAWYLPEERKIITQSQFLDMLCATLGGRAAEYLVFNEVSSGALDDLEKVTKQAYSMVAYMGLSEKLGNISFYDSTGIQEQFFQKPYSEATAKLIDEEVAKLIENAYSRTKQIIIENREKLERLTQLLLEKETVFVGDLEAILGKRK